MEAGLFALVPADLMVAIMRDFVAGPMPEEEQVCGAEGLRWFNGIVDVVHLGMTCRHLHALSLHASLWSRIPPVVLAREKMAMASG
eukprot:m51a1_g6918 hypothetical protein (86) ;mRNA; f:138197-139494